MPDRRSLRRISDVDGRLGRVPAPSDRHRSGMILAAVAATLAQLLDLSTFARMVIERGSAAEANPFVATLLADHGLAFVAVTKIAALALVVGVIAVLARRDQPHGHPRLALVVAACAVAAGLLGGWTNVAVIV